MEGRGGDGAMECEAGEEEFGRLIPIHYSNMPKGICFAPVALEKN